MFSWSTRSEQMLPRHGYSYIVRASMTLDLAREKKLVAHWKRGRKWEVGVTISRGWTFEAGDV